MNEQHQKVRVWLETLFGDEPIPAFEINSKTIQTLSSLVDINTQRDRDTKLLVEDLEQKRNEYASEANRIQTIISSVGLPLGSLSQSGSASIRTLANTALLLDLKDTKMSSYLLGINKLSKELQSSKEERMREKYSSVKLLRKTKAALVKNDSLTKAYETLEEQMSLQEPILKKRAEETGFFKRKSEDYQKRFEELQNYQKQAKFEPSLCHNALEKKYEDVLRLEDELKPMKSKLETYNSLPPDLSLAKVKLEEAKRELAALEEQLTKNIDSLHSM